MRRSTASLLSVALMVSACSGSSEGSAPDTDNTTNSSSDPGCIRFTGDHSSPVDTGSVAGDALYLAGEVFVCAGDVVVVEEGDLSEVVVAAQLAAALAGPLLFPEPRLAAELGRLKPDRVHLVGGVEVSTPSGSEKVLHDVPHAAAATRELLEVDREDTRTALDADVVVDAVKAMATADGVIATSLATTSTGAPSPEIDQSALVTGLAQPPEADALWLADAADPATILMAAATGRAIGATVAAFDGDDMLGHPELAEAMAGRPADSLRFVGGVGEATQWELAVLRNGRQLPGGGFHVLPRDEKRRYVAFYGHPETDALGVLGEQGPAETRARMEEFVSAYSADGSQVVPTFEMIVSVAAAGAGEDGDYSFEWPVDTFTPWIDFAAENGMYVVLDLQSGREDFLSQARLYEELLAHPHVGLALDPEWRLRTGQLHLEQVGTVDAAEINETVNWVADLVRDRGLPQKLMMVHQFRTSMITNRADIVSRPEIQMVIQMDGDGTEAQKDATWSRILEGAGEAHWAWGWKNFFDEDEPGPPTPESTMSKEPSPVYVSYQ